MSKAIITESHLTDIANAIIAKGGSDTPLKPSEMAAAIAAIPTGGGDRLIDFLNGDLTGELTIEGVETIPAFSLIGKVGGVNVINLPDTVRINGFDRDNGLFSGYNAGVNQHPIVFNAPKLEEVGPCVFYYAKLSALNTPMLKRCGRCFLYSKLNDNEIESIDLPNLVTANSFFAAQVPSLRSITCDSLQSISYVNFMYGDMDLLKDISFNSVQSITSTPWNYLYAVENLYLDSLTSCTAPFVTYNWGSRAADKTNLNVYIRNSTCAQIMAMGSGSGTFPFQTSNVGQYGTSIVYHGSDGVIKYIGGAWTIVSA